MSRHGIPQFSWLRLHNSHSSTKTHPLLLSIALLLSFAVSFSGTAESRSIYDKMLFHPHSNFRYNPEAIGEVKRKEFTFTDSYGKKLKGWYFDLPNSDKIVLISEGNGGNMGWLIPLTEMLLQCNCSVMLYDYQGYGNSEGSPSLRRLVDDGTCAYDYMTKNFAGDKKIILLGVSLGAGVTCQIASQKKADALILSSPFSSLLNMARINKPFFKYIPAAILPRQRLDNVAVLKKPHPPVLILHGTKDELIPISESEKLYKSIVEPKTFVTLAGAGHNDTFRVTKEEYLSALKEFFEKLP